VTGRRLIFGFAGVAGTLASPAAAQVFLAGYLGAAATRRADLHLTLGNDRVVFESVPFRGRSFQSPVYYGFRAGTYLTRRFGVEAEFVHLKIYADLDRLVNVSGTLRGEVLGGRVPLRQFAQQFEITHGLNLVLVNAIVRQPLLRSFDPARAPLTLVFRGGAGPTIPRPEVILLGVSGGDYQVGRIAVQGAAGIEARVAWRIGVMAEYKYTYTPARIDVPGGQAALAVHSQHVVGGIFVRL
jgi:hypothetical protein